MQLSVLRTRIADEVGLDPTTESTRLNAWINETYKFICAMDNWPWLIKNGTFQTVADNTSLTASVTATDTTVTLSSTVSNSLANDYMIRFDTISDDWYLITAHTAGTDTLTISPAYVGSSDLTAGTCTIRKVYYSLASDVDRVIMMRQATSDSIIESVNIQTFDRYLPDPSATGDPLYFAYVGLDSSNYHRITLYPIPDSVLNAQYRYYQRIVELSADSDTPLIPDPWHQLIVFMALASFGHPYMDDDRVNIARQRAMTVLNEMQGKISPVPGTFPVIQPWDRRRQTRPYTPQFPDNFPINWR